MNLIEGMNRLRKGGTVRFRTSKLMVLVSCAVSFLSCGNAQSIPRDLKTWTLEYTAGGGMMARGLILDLTQAGELTVSNIGKSRVTTHASAELMETVQTFLKGARRSRPPQPGPDQPYESLTLTSGGATYQLAVEKMGGLFFQTAKTVMNQALLGAWWESKWELCHPAPQLTAEQMDSPIDKLVFRDGQFSVHWRAKGSGISGGHGEHPVPGYSGRYSIAPDYAMIHFDSGPYTPRDFSGDGSFRINGDKLVLTRVWLGTSAAKQKPDICELTFTRLSQ